MLRTLMSILLVKAIPKFDGKIKNLLEINKACEEELR